MLLRLVSPIVRLALWLFFRRIDLRGRDQVPSDRALIFVANHPNVMLDTMILGLYAPGEIPHFLGKTTLFKRPVYSFFLRRLRVIPVSRAQDRGPGHASNQDMLRLACRILEQGRSLALYPEGGSEPGIKVRQLKPGAARIALRVEDEADGGAGVCIVPVGLTYSDPGRFRSEVAAHFGEAIEVAPFLPAYRSNHGEGARRLTELVHQRLAGLTLHIENPELEDVVRDLAAIYAPVIVPQIPDSGALSSELRAGQQIIRAVHHFADTHPDLVRSFGDRLRAHQRKLGRLALAPQAFSAVASPLGAGGLLLALFLAPLALCGFLANAIPYLLPRLFVRPYRQDPVMIGTVKLSVGAAAFLLYYLMGVIICGTVAGERAALGAALALPLSGLLTLAYSEGLLQKLPLWRGLAAPRRRRRTLERLTAERVQLLADLDALKEQYVAASGHEWNRQPTDPGINP